MPITVTSVAADVAKPGQNGAAIVLAQASYGERNAAGWVREDGSPDDWASERRDTRRRDYDRRAEYREVLPEGGSRRTFDEPSYKDNGPDSRGYGRGSVYNDAPLDRPNPSYRDPGYRDPAYRDRSYDDAYRVPPGDDRYSPGPEAFGEPYEAPSARDGSEARNRDYAPYRRDDFDERTDRQSYTQGEIVDAGHEFFGSVSKGLASVIEYAFAQAGQPDGYILGEDAGGAFVAGLRYGEGWLYSRRFGKRKVYWQGPSLGYDFGAEGSKTMVLVYNLRDPSQLFARFGGVQGSAYFVGGVSIQFQKRDDVTLAPIRSGVGLRLGANVGYLKYTRTPTWNPF
ncbi:MAG: DUF1134 domain-containing protein [Pseudomonadota bacterium]